MVTNRSFAYFTVRVASAARIFYEKKIPMEKEKSPTEICFGERLKVMITDGDYVLREGIDYELHYIRGLEDMEWLTIGIGKGKYKNLFFRGHENRSNAWSKQDAKEFREYLRSEIESNNF